MFSFVYLRVPGGYSFPCPAPVLPKKSIRLIEILDCTSVRH